MEWSWNGWVDWNGWELEKRRGLKKRLYGIVRCSLFNFAYFAFASNRGCIKNKKVVKLLFYYYYDNRLYEMPNDQQEFSLFSNHIPPNSVLVDLFRKKQKVHNRRHNTTSKHNDNIRTAQLIRWSFNFDFILRVVVSSLLLSRLTVISCYLIGFLNFYYNKISRAKSWKVPDCGLVSDQTTGNEDELERT